MTPQEHIEILRLQAARLEEILPAHRECLATALRLRAIGGYVTPEAAEHAVNAGVAAVNRTRQRITEIEAQRAAEIKRAKEQQPEATPAGAGE